MSSEYDWLTSLLSLPWFDWRSNLVTLNFRPIKYPMELQLDRSSVLGILITKTHDLHTSSSPWRSDKISGIQSLICKMVDGNFLSLQHDGGQNTFTKKQNLHHPFCRWAFLLIFPYTESYIRMCELATKDFVEAVVSRCLPPLCAQTSLVFPSQLLR